MGAYLFDIRRIACDYPGNNSPTWLRNELPSLRYYRYSSGGLDQSVLDLIQPLETVKLACRGKNVALVDPLLFHCLRMLLSVLD